MPLLSRLYSLWRNLFRKTQAEQELKEEMDAYLEMLIETKIGQGIHPAEARRQALIEIGGVEQVKEKVREAQMGHHLETLWQDLSYAVRSLRKHALLSIIIIATLTLGIGVSAGVFTYYNAEFLRARVDKDFDSFAQVYSAYTTDPRRPGAIGETTLVDYLAFRDGAKSLRDLAAYADFYAPLGKDDPVGVRSLLVTSNFFSLYDLGQPLMGRLLQPEDYAGARPVVVLGEGLWRNRFAADPQIVGKTANFNGQPVTVVGVAPTFAGIVNGATAWLPYTLETYLKGGDHLLRPGDAAWLRVAGRLNPGFSRGDAAAELKLLASQQDRLHPGRTTTLTVTNGSVIQQPTGTNREDNRLLFALVMGALIFIVVGVARDISTRRLGGPDDPTIYQPANLDGKFPAQPFVRFSGDGAAFTRAVAAAARELAPELSVEARTIQSEREVGTERLWRYARLIVLVCAMAVLLAILGIYGVVAFTVNRRTKEMGIRIALGARSKDIYHAVLWSSGRPIVIGLLIGLAVTAATFSAVAPLSRNVGFTVNALDPISYALTAILLAGVALSAMLVPARRASRIEPMMVLRDE